MTINDDAPARPVIEHAVENKQDFVFIVVASPRMNAGNPVPAGADPDRRLAEAGGRALDGSRRMRAAGAGQRREGAAARIDRWSRLSDRRLQRRRVRRGRRAHGAQRSWRISARRQERSRPSPATAEVAQQVCGTSPSVGVDTSAATGVPSDVTVDRSRLRHGHEPVLRAGQRASVAAGRRPPG